MVHIVSSLIEKKVALYPIERIKTLKTSKSVNNFALRSRNSIIVPSYSTIKDEFKNVVVTSNTNMSSLNCAERKVARLEWISKSIRPI